MRLTNPSEGTLTYITLATYADGKAEAALKELTAAVGTGGDGFIAKSPTGTIVYSS